MIAIIPAAGIGTRLRPHTFIYPKVLLNVAGRPMISYVMDSILENGITDVRLVLGYKEDQVIEYVKNTYKNINFEFIIQKEFSGLGHAVYLDAKDLKNEDVLIQLGDTILEGDFSQLKNSNTCVLGVKQVKNPYRFGIVEVDSNDVIVGLEEKPSKPKSNLALVGFYYIKDVLKLKEALDEIIGKNIRTKGEYQITDALHLMIEKGETFKALYIDGWYDCGKQETLLSTNQYLLSKNNLDYHVEGSLINSPVFIGKNVKIENSIIGPFCSIAEESKINNSIVENSIIGKGTVIKNMIIKDSILGENASIKGDYNRYNISNNSEITKIN